MGGVCDHAPQAVVGGASLGERSFDLAEHSVQRQAEPPDLGSRGRRLDASGQVPCRDIRCHIAHPLQRPQAYPNDQERHDGSRQDDTETDQQLAKQKVAEGGLGFRQGNREHHERPLDE